MKEVKLGRYAGPFKDKPPFENFIQSPIGLVPKAGGKTRLIFHLSYQFRNGNESVNYWIPKDLCSVKYKDLDHVIVNCLKLLRDLGDCTHTILLYSLLKQTWTRLFVRHRCESVTANGSA